MLQTFFRPKGKEKSSVILTGENPAMQIASTNRTQSLFVVEGKPAGVYLCSSGK